MGLTRISRDAAAVAALTLIALVVRALTVRDSLMGDELFMFNIVHDRSLGAALHLIRHTEKTPPLVFVFDWFTAKIGDPTLWVRLPSLVFGTALTPLGYLLGRRVAGRTTGLVAAGFLALDPFLIFYGVENRSYAALAFFAALSTLCLLEAVRTKERRWWIAYGISVIAVLYTHYAGFFVLAVQAAWGLWCHREQLKTQAIVYGLVVLAYLPWLPSYLIQQKHSANEARRIASFAPPSLKLLGTLSEQNLFGSPFVPLHVLPGTIPLIAAWASVGVATAFVLRRLRGPRSSRPRLSSPLTLIFLLAVATPIGVMLLSLRPHMSFLLGRNLIPSVVPAVIAISWLLTAAGRRVFPAVAGVVAVVLVIGCVLALQPSHRRTPYRLVAHFIDDRAKPADPIIQSFFLPQLGSLRTVVSINLSHRHPIATTPAQIAAAWQAGRRGGNVFQVIDLPGLFKADSTPPRPPHGFVLVAKRKYSGIDDALVAEFRYTG